nr:unnamed protein product [Callosobruchus chinensis]
MTDKVYDCNTCGKPYKHYPSLWRHKKYECQKEPAFRCYFCNYKAKQKVNLNLHILNKHKDKFMNSAETIASYSSSSLKYSCSTCGKAYRQNCSLWRHKKFECQKEPQFRCPYCPYKSKQKTPMMSHMIIKHKHCI